MKALDRNEYNFINIISCKLFAERSVKLTKVYNKMLTNDDSQKRLFLQVLNDFGNNTLLYIKGCQSNFVTFTLHVCT